jgi:hypothetical protein
VEGESRDAVPMPVAAGFTAAPPADTGNGKGNNGNGKGNGGGKGTYNPDLYESPPQPPPGNAQGGAGAPGDG